MLGHDQIADRFSHTLSEGRLASTYLFVGPGGIGKRLFARRLAQCLFCMKTEPGKLSACGQCQSCQLMTADNHPDLSEVGLLKDKRALQLKQFVGDDEHRNRAGLCHDISLRPYLASRRVAIIDNADTFNTSTANALLKTLEEPPADSLLILIGVSETRQLPTIRSRSQIVRFSPLSESQIARLLEERGIVAEPEMARRVAQLSDGSLDQAVEMAEPSLWQLHNEAIGLLDAPVLNSVKLAELVHEYSNSAGKDAPARRTALVSAIGLITRHYRSILRMAPDQPTATRQLARIDRCLDAEYHIERNVHLQTVIQSWADDLARS